ncbi:MAG: septum formation protein Maf [Chitinophagales bacterium]|nr:septum formation protein Maf [Chitinophagales bacterium]
MLQLPYHVILASKSPRRKELLSAIVKDFDIKTKEVAEDYPESLKATEVPEYLALLKAETMKKDLKDNELLITADTIVTLNNKIYGKPKDKKDAVKILKELSGKTHEVITGVALISTTKKVTFKSITQVSFNTLSLNEINYYIDNFAPYDKAGAYAIQEWIGMVGIEKIVGDYFNVVGLPLNKLYKELKKF